MSFLRKILGSSRSGPPTSTAIPAVRVDEPGGPTAPRATRELRFLERNGRYYEAFDSPNGRFTLGLADSSPDGRTFGYRGGGKGSWILLNGEEVVAEGRLERPNDGAVADSGRFIVADWLFGDRLASRFYAFDPNGRPIIEAEFGANSGTSTITADGRFVAVTTLSNPARPEWSELLIAYDLDAAVELWRVQLAGRPELITMDPANDEIVLALREGITRTVRLSSGERLAGWDVPLSKFQALEWLEAELKVDTAAAETAPGWIEKARALAGQFADYPGWQARCLRVEGQAFERLGKVEEAKTAYQRGLAIDPRLGVRRRLAALGFAVPEASPRSMPPPTAVVDDRPYATTTCPSCGAELNPLPKAKSRCRRCGQTIWVRGGPDGLRHLLREDQLEANQQSWSDAFEARALAAEEAAAAQRSADKAAGFLVGDYRPEVVGESHYQAAISRWVPQGADTREGVSVVLELVPDPKNPYDHDAVAVLIDGELVGHIDRDEARLVGAMLRKLGGGRALKCRGTIRGGADYPFGVSIDGIPDSYEFS